MQIKKRSPESELLYKALSQLKPDEYVSYADLSKQVGFEVIPYKRRIGSIRNAMKMEGTAVIDPADGGYRRLADPEVVDEHSRRQKKKIRNAARRGSSALESVNYSLLSDSGKTAHNAHQSAFGAIKLFTKPKIHKSLEGAVAAAGVTFPPVDVLRMFSK